MEVGGPGLKAPYFFSDIRRVKARRFHRRLAARGPGERLVIGLDSWLPTSGKTGQMWGTRQFWNCHNPRSQRGRHAFTIDR